MSLFGRALESREALSRSDARATLVPSGTCVLLLQVLKQVKQCLETSTSGADAPASGAVRAALERALGAGKVDKDGKFLVPGKPGDEVVIERSLDPDE